jgi:hypothetical protein
MALEGGQRFPMVGELGPETMKLLPVNAELPIFGEEGLLLLRHGTCKSCRDFLGPIRFGGVAFTVLESGDECGIEQTRTDGQRSIG